MKKVKGDSKSAVSPAQPINFNLRDLNRIPAEVLKACDRLGSISINARDGREYELRRKKPESASGKRGPDFDWLWAALEEEGCVAPLPEDDERINRIIAGES